MSEYPSEGAISALIKSNRETEVVTDFEQILEQQRDEDMPEEVLMVALEQKHLSTIARCWTITCIVLQVLGILNIILCFCLVSIVQSKDGNGRLTPLFFISSHGGGGLHYQFYFKVMGDKGTCERHEIETCFCGMMDGSSMLTIVIVLLFCLANGFVIISYGIYAQIKILRGSYFRYTNLLLMFQAIIFIFCPLLALVAWQIGDDEKCSELGDFVIFVPPLGILLLLSFIIGRYYANKLDYAQTISNLLDTVDTAHPDF